MSVPAGGAPACGRIGPGRLVLVVGPSGAGKDTLIALARAACAPDGAIVFPQRIVTREASAFEDNEIITAARFAETAARGGFALHWRAHELAYALPGTVSDDIRAGRIVVANVSRTVVTTARDTYARVTVVLVTAPSEVLSERLSARARASDGPLDERLRRMAPDTKPDATINNVGSAEEHARRLLTLIRGPA